MCLPDYPFRFPGKNGTNVMNILTSFLFAPTYLLTPNSNSFPYKSKNLSYLYPLFLHLFCYHTDFLIWHQYTAGSHAVRILIHMPLEHKKKIPTYFLLMMIIQLMRIISQLILHLLLTFLPFWFASFGVTIKLRI